MRRPARFLNVSRAVALLLLVSGAIGSHTTSPASATAVSSAPVEDPTSAYEETGDALRQAFGEACTNVHVDATCDEAKPYSNLRRATVLLFLTVSSSFCTGTLINTPSDKPVVLTAFHCVQSTLEELSLPSTRLATKNATATDDFVVDDVATMNDLILAQFVFAFEFEQPCGGLAAATLRNPSQLKLMQGARALYGNAETDIMLLELADDIPATYQPYYMGWSARSDDVPSAAVAFHHPSGDVKKVAITQRAPKTVTTSDISSETISATGAGNYFLVTDWDQGTMEPGSSGAALVDTSSMQVVGTLTGTPTRAACSRQVPVIFAKLSTAWELYGLWEVLGGDGPREPLDMEGRDPEESRLQLQVAPDVIRVSARNKRLVNPFADGISFRVTGPFEARERVQLQLKLESSTLSEEELTNFVGALNTTQVVITRNDTFFNVTLTPGKSNITNEVYGLFRLVIRANSTTDPTWTQQRSVVGLVGPSPFAGYIFRFPIHIETLPYTHVMTDMSSYVGILQGVCPKLAASQTSSSTLQFSQCTASSANRSPARSNLGGRRLMQAEDPSDSEDEINDIIAAIVDIIAGTTPSGPGLVSSPTPSSSRSPPRSPPRSSSPPAAPRSPSRSPAAAGTSNALPPGAVRGVVFSYNATEAQRVNITTCPDAAVDTVLMLFSADRDVFTNTAEDLALVAFNDDAASRVTCSTIAFQQLTADLQYYIVVTQNNAFITNEGANPVTLRIREA